MNKKKIAIFLLIAVILLTLFQIGFAAENSSTTQTTETQSTTNTIVISNEVKNKILQSDPTNYEKNSTNYINLLTFLKVHQMFKKEIESLILSDYKLPDILIAYEYLFQNFGKISDLKLLISQKNSGESWEEIFSQYDSQKADFIPSSFDSDLLEKLMETDGLTPDDIMIADRISFETNKPFEDVVNEKLETTNWQEINANLGILYSFDQLPRVEVTSEELSKYTKAYTFTEQQVVEAFVLANKLGVNVESVLEKLKSGYKEEAIFAESYRLKYE